MERIQNRRYMLGVLSVVYAFNFMDRNVMALLVEPIKADLNLSDTQIGLLTGIAFAFFYSTLGIPIARWADRGNRVTIISVTALLWSSMVVVCGITTNFTQLLLARIGVSVGEAGCVPPAQSLIADYYSRSERANAMSIFMLGGPISVVVGFCLAGWINEFYGWRVVFYWIGVPGVILAALVKYTLIEPRILKSNDKSGASAGLAQPVQTTVLKTFRILWQHQTYKNVVIAFTLLYFFSYGVAQWMPALLMRTHGIGTGELGSWYALIWGGGGAFGTYLGGLLATKYLANNECQQLRIMAVILIAFIPLYLGIYLVPSKYLVFALMLVSAVIFCSIFGPLYSLIQDLVPPQYRSMSVAVVLLFSNLIGMGLGPLFVGMLSDFGSLFFGDNSLRYALVIWTPGYLWASYHLYKASKHVDSDLSAIALSK